MRTWLSSDERESIIARTSAAGALSAANKYDEYGVPQTDASGHSLNAGLFQYTGQAWISQLGMDYYKARIYSPTLGRFMQTDPIGYDGDGPNLYAYTLNDPVNNADPFGLDECTTLGTGDDGLPKVACKHQGDTLPPGITDPLGVDYIIIGQGGLLAGFIPAWWSLDSSRSINFGDGFGRADGADARDPAVPPTAEEMRRGNCNAFSQAAQKTPIASAIADGSSVVAALADTTARIAVFVPGGQSVAAVAEGASFGAQTVEAAANIYIGRATGNYSGIETQFAGFAAGQAFGFAVGKQLTAIGLPRHRTPRLGSSRTLRGMCSAMALNR